MTAFDAAAFDASAFDLDGGGGGSTGSAHLVISVTAAIPGAAAVPLSVSILPPDLLDGSQTVAVGGGGRAGQWTVVVMLGGIDVTDRVIGEIRVDAEEGAARIMEFTLRLPSLSVVNLSSWTGRAVTLDIADASTGAPRYPSRLFTGVVDTPSLDLPARQIALRCTDDLQGRCDAVDNVVLLEMIGGYTSPAVFDPASTGWSYAQDRLSTVAAALDISPHGDLRLTPWAAKAVADIVLDDQWIGDGSMSVQIAERAALVNDVTVEFGYRFPRIKAEAYPVAYEAVNMTGFAQYLLDGKWFMQRAQVVAALEKAGGTVESISYTPLPTTIIAVGYGFFTPSAADLVLCMGFSALVSFDYTQTVEEQHAIRVFNQRSIDAVGSRRATVSGALQGEYPDLVATESAIKLFRTSVLANPPADQAGIVASETNSVDATLTPETDRAAADAAMEALIAMAKVRILASHRANRVRATVPLNPAIDLDKTLRMTADGVDAQGKCVAVVHRLSPETGTAVSDIAIALSALDGVGIVHDDDPVAAPAGTVAGATPLNDVPVVSYNAGPNDDHVISVTFPMVESEQRTNAEIPLRSEIAAGIAEDLFIITLQD